MGVSSSTNLVSLSTNPLLLKLTSPQPIPLRDPFWETLLEFSFQSPDNRYLKLQENEETYKIYDFKIDFSQVTHLV